MTKTWKRQLGALAMAAIAAAPAAGGEACRVTSPDYTVALLELYTSEGCDSCPPADRWFSALDLGSAAPRAAALAFHVDYWDRLGWRDRFGSSAFTQRQYEQMQRHDTSFVYTPQVLLQGNDFPSWRSVPQPAKALAAINARPARATIELAAQPTDGAAIAVDVHVRVLKAPDREHAVVAVALVQSGLGSDVKAGENQGKHLVHDHVVRAWQSGLAVGATGELQQHVVLPLPRDSEPLEVVALVEDAASGDVLQVITLPLCARL
jgi:hypothetical protein